MAVIEGGEKRVTLPYFPMDHQLSIHRSKARYRVVVSGRRSGKTEAALNDLIIRACNKPGLYWYVSSTYRSVKSIAWRRLKNLLKDDPAWKFNEVELSAINNELDVIIELKGADSAFSLLGVGLSGLVLDECAILKEDVWTEVLRPMLLDTNGWVLIISTPKGKNWLYDLYMKGVEGKDKEWQAWRYPTSINKYIDPKELEEIKNDLPERLYRQEILAEFLENDIGVFRGVRKCAVSELNEPEDGRFYVMGADLGKVEDFTVLTVMDAVRRKVVAIERFKSIPWPEIKGRIQTLAKKYNDALVIIDSTGVGSPVYDDLQISNVSIEGFKFTNESKYNLISNLIISIEQRLITFPNDEILIDELEAFEYTITSGNRIVYNAPQGKHDDCVYSLALACWGIKNYIRSAQVVEQRQAAEEEVVDRVGRGIPVRVEEDQYFNISGY